MAKNNRTCIVCGKQYSYCPNCDGIEKPLWLSIYHSDNCREIFQVINQHQFQHISDEDAIAKLKKLDLSVLDDEFANENIKHKVDFLLSLQNDTTKTKAKRTKNTSSEKV